MEQGFYSQFKDDNEDLQPFQGNKGLGFLLELGSNMFIDGFESQLVGVKAGDLKRITVTFPEDYNSEYLKQIKDISIELKSQLWQLNRQQ